MSRRPNKNGEGEPIVRTKQKMTTNLPGDKRTEPLKSVTLDTCLAMDFVLVTLDSFAAKEATAEWRNAS